MSMSTKIDDLPVPQLPPPPQDNTELIKTKTQDTNVSLEIKKKDTDVDENQNESILTKLKNEVSEENVLLLVFLVLAASNYIDRYLTLLPVVGQYIGTGFVGTITKCSILFVVYVLIKMFVLPKVQL